jgi:hypothetical protein
MPRKSLPPALKTMKGYPVVLSETTEEELQNYIRATAIKFEKCFDAINEKQNRFLDLVIDQNPYEGMSWRKPVKHLEWIDWMGTEQDKYFAFMKIIMDFKHDFLLCVEALEWDESDIQFMIEKYGNINDKEKEFGIWERLRAKQSRSAWEIKDAEWIVEYTLKQEHLNHKPRSEWEIEFKTIESEMGLAFLNRWFPDGIPNTDETCKYCIAKQNFFKKAEQVSKQHEEEQLRLDEDWQKEKASFKKEQDKLKCECCNFSTFNSEVYDIHMESKEHLKKDLLKRTYCKVCEIQCRTETDFEIHIQTKKHKYATGELEKQTEFHCEKCNYKTFFKQHFEKHCATKSHNEKV